MPFAVRRSPLAARRSRELGEAAPTQDEMLQQLGQLHSADLFQTDVTPDALELFERGEKQAKAKGRRSRANPMALRIPLVDPGAFLDRHAPLWRGQQKRPCRSARGRG